MTASITGILNAVGEGWAFVLIGAICLVFCFPVIWILKTWGWKQRMKRAGVTGKLAK